MTNLRKSAKLTQKTIMIVIMLKKIFAQLNTKEFVNQKTLQ